MIQKNYFNFSLFVLAFLFCLNTSAQKFVINNISLTENGKELANGFCGGINSPVISQINLNNDAYPDLFLFDKYGDKPLTFINQGPGKYPTYIYEPVYESVFPKDLWGWAVIRDFNKDGVPDIFGLSGTNSGSIFCYRGNINNGTLQFVKHSEELLYDFNGFLSRIWSFKGDLPGFADVNNDGDLDVLAFNNFGGTNIEYYENQAVENGHSLDSIVFLLTDLCWGRFVENSLNNSITLNYCKTDGGRPLANPSSRHQGGTIFTFDYEDDKDVDLLMGDVSFSTMLYVRNDGDTSYSQVTFYDTIFPAYDVPVNLPLSPAAYEVDYNNDGALDLMISTFGYETSPGLNLDFNSIHVYENIKTPGLQQYAYRGDTFLVNQIFDLGTTSRPVFHDVDNDGKNDILVGVNGKYRPSGTPLGQLAYLRNVSNAGVAKFEVVDRDWCSLEQFNLNGLYPAFGDIDGDSLADLIVGDNYGFLTFFKNSGTSLPYTSITASQFMNIDAGENAQPFVYDVNKDGLKDLVIGRKDGKISYYWNFGSPTLPKFSEDSVNKFFGLIRVNDWALPVVVGNATPFIRTESGKDYLYSGCERGIVFKFEINPDSIRKGTFAVTDSNLMNHNYEAATSVPGESSSVYIADINGDGINDYLMGSSRGGVRILSDVNWNSDTTIAIGEISNENIFVYPNPANNQLMVKVPDAAEGGVISVFDLNGRAVYSAELKDNNIIDLSSLNQAAYVLRIQTGTAVFSRKVVVIK